MDYSIEALGFMPDLAPLVQGGYVYQSAQVLTATAIANGCFALVNKAGNGLPVWLLSAKVQSTAAMEVDLFALNVDPALTAGNTPCNLRLGMRGPGATFEAQVIATPANVGQFGAVEANSGDQSELVTSGVLYIPPGLGVLIASALVAGNVALTLVWAEIGADVDNYLAQRE